MLARPHHACQTTRPPLTQASAADGAPLPAAHGHNPHGHSASDTSGHGGGVHGAGGGKNALPESLVYILSKEYFSRPMLEPQVGSNEEGPTLGTLAVVSPIPYFIKTVYTNE